MQPTLFADLPVQRAPGRTARQQPALQLDLIEHIASLESIEWFRACPQPVALVLLPWVRGTTIAHRGADGLLYGCRDVSAGASHDRIVAAWIEGHRAQGLPVRDMRDR